MSLKTPSHRRTVMRVLIFLFLSASLPFGAFASSGDESWAFRTCVATCSKTGCASEKEYNGTTSENLEDQSSDSTVDYCSPLCAATRKNSNSVNYRQTEVFWLTASSWDCSSDCTYRCMWFLEDSKQITTATTAAVGKVEKYFGKWPFIRIFGAQEPASVVFSILNLVANMVCSFRIIEMVQKYRKMNNNSRSTRSTSSSTPTTSSLYIYTIFWIIHFALSSNAWLMSSIFHCRDTRLTERLDYFSAGALVAFNLFLSVTRVFGVTTAKIFASIGIPIAVMYVVHVWRMLNVLFDYGLHVGLCVAAGAVQTAVWLVWALGSKSGRSHPGRTYLLAFMVCLNVAMLLEILDFPPLWKILDAHALWHAATAPLTMLWYRFVAADVALILGLKSSSRVASKTKH